MNIVKVGIPESKPYLYPIIIGHNILNDAGKFIKEYFKGKKILIISNERVFSLLGNVLLDSLNFSGFHTDILLIPEGEEYKNVNILESIWTKAIETRLERRDAIAALGGGVIGDIAGFAASTYLRGIDFIQIPTTLLAQVDSSVGGKVAVNHILGKNLIGCFYQPKLVIAHTSALSTLPERELKVGLAEVLKYAFIEKSCGLYSFEKGFASFLKENKDDIINLKPDITAKMINYCCELKSAVVNKDEKESELRAILNFGHTIGHAIEKCSAYKIVNHGEAVAVGMRSAFLIAELLGLISQSYFNNCIDLINQYGLENKIPEKISPEALYEAMKVDKKVLSGKIRFVLPVNEAEVKIFENIDKETIIKSMKNL